MRVIKNRIKELREAQDMTLETLAELVSLSPSYVQRLEKGDRNLSVKHFEAFAAALRVQPEDLIKSISEHDRALLAAIHSSDPATKAVIYRLAGIDRSVIQRELPSSPPETSSAKRK